jgi:GNAT superfamily N-acetyltransferase
VPGHLPTTTVATVGSRLVGFAMVRDDQVEEVYVAASARGTGVAAALLRDAESRVAVSFDAAWLAVAAGNARARRFYERQGWRDAGGFDYDAEIAGGTMPMPCRRYVKALNGGPA